MRPMSAPVVMAPGLAPLGSGPYPRTSLPAAFAGQTAPLLGAQGGAPMTAPGAKGIRLVSLGGSCGPKMAFQELGRDAETLPFDWMCTTVEGVMNFLTTDFQGFFQFNSQETSVLPPSNAKISVFRTAHHSWWHDDPTLPATQEKYRRRIQRLGAMRADSESILFVRLATTTEELPMADRLSQILVGKFGRKAMLLFIVGNQSPNRVGPYMAGSNQNLLVYFLAASSGKAVCCPAISVGLNWAAGQTVNCQRFQDLQAIKGLAQPHCYGFFGMGGIPAFDNLPPSALASAPPRADGKSNAQGTQPVQTGVGKSIGSFQSGIPGGFGSMNFGVPKSSGSVSTATGDAIGRSCRGVSFTQVAGGPPIVDPLSRSVGPSRRSASQGPSFRSALEVSSQPVESSFRPGEDPPPLVPKSAVVAAAAPMLSGDVRGKPHQFSFSRLPAPVDENKLLNPAAFNAQDGTAKTKPPFAMVSFDSNGPVAKPLLSSVTPPDTSLAEAAKTLLSNMSSVDPSLADLEQPSLTQQKRNESHCETGDYKIGDRCEVWSTTHNQWCPAKVQKFDGPMIYVKYRNPAGQLMTKGVPYGHAFLRKV